MSVSTKPGPFLCKVKLAVEGFLWPLNCQAVGTGWPLNCQILCSVRSSPSVVVFSLVLFFCKFKSHFSVMVQPAAREGGGGGTHTFRRVPADRAKVSLERPGTVVLVCGRSRGVAPVKLVPTTVAGRSGQACNEDGGGGGAKLGTAFVAEYSWHLFPPQPRGLV